MQRLLLGRGDTRERGEPRTVQVLLCDSESQLLMLLRDLTPLQCVFYALLYLRYVMTYFMEGQDNQI